MLGRLFVVFGITCLLVNAAFASSAAIIGDPTQAKTETCVACHNKDGNSVVGMWPKIAGQHQSYLYYQLQEFKKGAAGLRNDPVMYPMVQQFSDQDLANLAAFYANETMTSGQVSQKYVSLGEKIYKGGILDKGISACIACHGPQGLGNELAKYPKLSGQNADYTITQLKNYRSLVRKTGPIMSSIAIKMTDEEIEAVSNYVAGLH